VIKNTEEKLDLEKIHTEIEDKKHDYYEDTSIISGKDQLLIVRIPQKVTEKFKLSKGDELKFSGFTGGTLNIEVIKNKDEKTK
jgi:hypothetical protein